MKQLCDIFIDKVVKPKVSTFNIDQFQCKEKISVRRIYDLLNILEGCGFIRQISKGTFEWCGFNSDISTEVRIKDKKKLTLKYWAQKVKNILIESE